MIIPRSVKELTARVSLLALGATFELASRYVPAMSNELSDWEETRNVVIGVLPRGPFITVKKEGPRFRFLGFSQPGPG